MGEGSVKSRRLLRLLGENVNEVMRFVDGVMIVE